MVQESLGSSQALVLFVEVPPADSIDDRTSPLSGIRSCDETTGIVTTHRKFHPLPARSVLEGELIEWQR